MNVRIADLNPDQDVFYEDELRFLGERWLAILGRLRTLSLIDEKAWNRMATPAERVQVTQKEAREIGLRVESWLIEDMTRQALARPTIPPYIVPIATSNGLWIDPALPILNPRLEFPQDLFSFCFFCLNCKGFSVN